MPKLHKTPSNQDTNQYIYKLVIWNFQDIKHNKPVETKHCFIKDSQITNQDTNSTNLGIQTGL